MSELPKIEFNPGYQSIDEVTLPEKLPANTLQILENMTLDKQTGAAITRKGFSRYNNNQVDTTGTIENLFDVNDVNGNNFLLANIGTKLRKSTNGTGAFTDIQTGLTQSKMRKAVFGSNFIFTNGNDELFYSDLTNVYNASVTPPDVTAITVTVDTNTLKAIIRGWRYAFRYILQDGQLSGVSQALEVPEVIIYSSYQNINLASLSVSADSRVISKQIFRSKISAPTEFYLVATIDNSLTTFVDNLPDSSLDTTTVTEYLLQSHIAKYICANNDRIFLGNITKTYTNRVIAPAKNDADSIIQTSTPGSIDAGTYKYAYSYVDLQGNESILVNYLSIVVPVPSSLVTYQVGGQGMPFPIISATYVVSPDGSRISTVNVVNDPNIKYLRIYRTKANGSSFYFLQNYVIPSAVADNYTLGGEITLTDTANDSTLSVIYPKSAHSPTEIATLSSSVIFSNLDTYIEFPELNYIEIYPDDSDQITGIFDDDNGIVIFKQNSICKLYTNGDTSNWQVQKLVHNVGCDSPDSIIKYQNSYFFVYKNAAYIFNGSSARLISYKRKGTFDSITSINGAAFFTKYLWYVLSVNIGTQTYLLCYDTKFGEIDTWYKFTISKADTVFERQFSADKGKLVFGGNTYLNYYNESQQNDTDSGVVTDITAQLQTKDFTLDNFITMRLMYFHIDYYRLHNSITAQALFQLIDSTTNNNLSLSDTDETYDESIFKIDTDGMSGSMKRVKKISFYAGGEAISKIFNARLDYQPEPWRERRKHKPNVQGIGMQTGSNFGVNE